MRITAPVTDYIKASLPSVTGDLVVRGAALMERLAAGVAGTYLQGKGAEVVPAYEKTMPPLTTKGDLIVQGTDLPERLAGAASGFYLQSQGAGQVPIYKQTMPPLTTKGDLLTQGAATPTRIPAVASGKVLTATGAGNFPAYWDLFNTLTTKGDLWIRGTTYVERIAAGALDTYFKAQGAGNLPIYEKMHLKDTGVKIGSGTRTSSGAQAISGVGFQPSVVVFITSDDSDNNLNISWGFDDGTIHMTIELEQDGTVQRIETALSLYVKRDASNLMYGSITALGSDGFTITWSKAGTVGCRFIYLCLP